MRRLTSALALLSVLGIANSAAAATISIDLSGSVTGTFINGVGGDFSQIFAGQSVLGTGVTGAPTDPLTLATAGTVDVAFFDPGVSAAANSLLSQPGNAGPLALRLDSLANAITWTMGFGNGGAVVVDLFALNGSVVGSQTFSGLAGYTVFSISGLGDFAGIQFRDNTDAGGLRFMNFSYETAGAAAVPEPATLLLLGTGIAALVARRIRR